MNCSAASGQNESTGQSVHFSSPVSSLYVPLAHATQLLMFSGVYPGRHWHEVMSGDCTGETECVGHSEGVAVAKVQYVFSGHSEQRSGPYSALWKPGSHGKQLIPDW